MRLSVVVPALEEADALPALAANLAPLRARGAELILVDGGSVDTTVELASAHFDRVLRSPAGRALQMNAGAAAATGTVLLFLHADTRLPADADLAIGRALAAGASWGHFAVLLSGSHPAFRVIERMMNLRSRISRIATGDQGIFVRRDAFEAVGGFPAVALMEDIRLSAALRRRAKPACLAGPVLTSSRRWESGGIARTVARMWWLRAAHAAGADPAWLARRYER